MLVVRYLTPSRNSQLGCNGHILGYRRYRAIASDQACRLAKNIRGQVGSSFPQVPCHFGTAFLPSHLAVVRI